jgi:hypothetical protein
MLARTHPESRRLRPGPLPEQLELVADPRALQPEAALEAGELYAAVAALPGDFRDVLVAVDITGLSYKEAAHALQESGLAATVKILHSEAANDRLEINTLAGRDSVDSSGLAAGASSSSWTACSSRRGDIARQRCAGPPSRGPRASCSRCGRLRPHPRDQRVPALPAEPITPGAGDHD